MHRYSELSKPQKSVIDGMRLHGILYHSSVDDKFHLQDERGFLIKVSNATAKSLEHRGYIMIDNNISTRTFYKLNPEIK